MCLQGPWGANRNGFQSKTSVAGYVVSLPGQMLGRKLPEVTSDERLPSFLCQEGLRREESSGGGRGEEGRAAISAPRAGRASTDGVTSDGESSRPVPTDPDQQPSTGTRLRDRCCLSRM